MLGTKLASAVEEKEGERGEGMSCGGGAIRERGGGGGGMKILCMISHKKDQTDRICLRRIRYSAQSPGMTPLP